MACEQDLERFAVAGLDALEQTVGCIGPNVSVC
jgi:hypothetical protein